MEVVSTMDKIKKQINPEYLGEVLGDGITTVAIDCYSKYHFASMENEVLIITSDKNKAMFYEEVFKDTDLKIEYLPENIEDDKNFEFIKMLCEEHDLKVFYMPKLERLAKTEEEEEKLGEITRKIENLIGGYSEFYPGEIPVDLLDELTLGDYGDIIVNATKKALKIANDVFTKKLFLDLHEGQFMIFQERVFCIDPILEL